MSLMAPVKPKETAVRSLTTSARQPLPRHDQESWDNLILELRGTVHQSWRWGAFRECAGDHVERIETHTSMGTGMAQVIFKRRGPVSTAFVPRGPLVQGNHAQVLPQLFASIERACRRHRALTITIEPERPLELEEVYQRSPFVRSQSRYMSARTVMMPLVDDETLVRRMHATKRKQFRRVERRGIHIEHAEATESNLNTFHGLLEETSIRNEFRINVKEYYADFLETFGDDAALMFAVVDGEIAAGLIAASFGEVGTDMFAGSSTNHRDQGSTTYLKYQMMRWARERGCTHYDLGGIPETDPGSPEGPDLQQRPGHGRNDAGIYRFKTEFGGEIVTFPPALECRYRPAMSWMVRHLKAIDRAVRH